MAAITPEHYYLLALCFTCAYVLPFLIFLGRFDQSDPKIKALHRMLLGVMGWSLFDLIITHMAQKHSPETALTAFRWLSFLFLLYPPASFELILALLERDSRGMRLLVYAPYAGLYLWGLLAPGQVGGSTFGIANPLPQASEIWNEGFRVYSLVASVFFLSWLLSGAWRQRLPEKRREMLIIFLGGACSGLWIMAARRLLTVMGPGFPFVGSLSVAFTCLAAFLGARLYGRVLSSQALYQAILKASPNGLVRLRGQAVEWANQAMAQMTGLERPEALEGRLLAELLDPTAHPGGERRGLAEGLARGQLSGREVGLIQPRGQALWCLASGAPLDAWHPGAGSLVVFSDLSARRTAEEERLAREKLQAAIATAGAVCHELNQPLQAITSRLELMLLRLGQSEPPREHLEALMAQTRRMVEITRRMQNLTSFQTKAYLDQTRILDLKRSSE